MPPLLLFFLIIYVYAHGTSVRCLGINIESGIGKQILINKASEENEDMGKMDIRETKIPSQLTHEISVGDQGITEEEGLLASMGLWKDFRTSMGKEKSGGTKGSSGNKVIASSRKDFQQVAKIEGLKNKRRAILSSASDDSEEAITSNENDVGKDVVVMDYAQPHRKPPIHNEKD